MEIDEIFRSIDTQQDLEEIKVLVKRLEENLPLTTVIEIGIFNGGTLKLWETLVPKTKESLIIGIDPLPDIKWDYNSSPVDIKIVTGCSENNLTREDVKRILGTRKVDFLFIDARHWNDSVKEDLENYGGFVREGGIIALHDTVLFHSFWDKLTWNKEEKDDNVPYHFIDDEKKSVIFHKEEIKINRGIGILWNVQNVIKFKEI